MPKLIIAQDGRPVKYCCRIVFGRPFVKRFDLCYIGPFNCLSVLSCLSRCCVAKRFDGSIWNLACIGLGLGPGHIVLDGTQLPLPKGAQPPNFRPILCGNSWIDQDATWYREVGLVPSHIVPSSPKEKGGTAPNFNTMSVVAKRLDGWRCHLVWR